MGCSGGELAAEVEGFCTQVKGRVAGWAADPASMRAAPDSGSLMREVGLCIRARAEDTWADQAAQRLSQHVDALALPSAEDKAHLEAIRGLLDEAAQRPLKR